MSRSGYSDEVDDLWELIRWRGAVASSFRGKRGQAFLREALETLEKMPVKELAAYDLESPDGGFCLLGAVGKARGLELQPLNELSIEKVANAFSIAPAMAKEIVYMNDELWKTEEPDSRWARMRRWVASCIRKEKVDAHQAPSA